MSGSSPLHCAKILRHMSNNNILKFFDRRVLLTLKKRKDNKPSRLPLARKELSRVGLNENEYDVFYALDAIGPHQSFTLSQRQILTDFIKSGNNYLLALEDDVMFNDLYPLYDAINDIKLNNIKWDVLYLGGNLLQGMVLEKRRNLCRVSNVWTTHAVAYTRYAAAVLLQTFPNENEVMYDTYLGSMGGRLKTYMVKPMVAVQRPDFSDIWGGDVNYLKIFDDSNKKMK